MKVYTKKGDTGTTQLIGGDRVSKSNARIASYGSIDELNAFLGLVRDAKECSAYSEKLIEIQNTLFTIGSMLAESPEGSKMVLPELTSTQTESLEHWIDEMEESLSPLTSFVLPGGHTTVSFIHIARCVCRRAERSIVEVFSQDGGNSEILAYVNRLSDLLFVLSRKISQDVGAKEIPWESGV